MFLKSLDINGFKSFADKTHIDFSDGITSLLGPNGCGKSNIVDSIKWVLGEQSTKTLRAGKMEDVIFNGTDTRKPLQFAEVALTIDNSERMLPTDMTEVEIKRRVFRSGESEYYINKNRCLLKNIRELFFDTGVGKSAYSILEQGKIDQILSQRPEDRRYIFEEAAGISRFKAECNEAQKKIMRTDENIAQVEILNKSEKRRYESLKTQAEKAISYNNLVKKQLVLDAQVHISKARAINGTIDIRNEKNESNKVSLAKLKESLDDFSARIDEAQKLMREATSVTTSLQYDINRAEEQINTRNSAISMLEERFREYLTQKKQFEDKAASIQSTLERDRAELDELQSRLEEQKDIVEENRKQVKAAQSMIDGDLEHIAAANSDIEAEEQSILDNEARIQELSAKLQEVIENLALELDEKMGEEYSSAKRKGAEDALIHQIGTLKSRFEDKKRFYSSLPDSVKDLKGKISEDLEELSAAVESMIAAYERYHKTIPPFIDTLLAPGGLLTEKRNISNEEERSRKAIARSREIIADRRALVTRLTAEVDSLRETVKQMEVQLASVESAMKSSVQTEENLRRSVSEKEVDIDDARASALNAEKRSNEIQEQLRENDQQKAELKSRIADLKEQLQIGFEDVRQKNVALSEREKEKSDALELISTLTHEVENNDMWIGQLKENLTALYTNFYNTYARNLEEFRSEFDNDDLPEQVLLENELTEIRKQIQALGPNINHMAVDDFEEAKKQYEFYSQQLDDLYKAKADLEEVLNEIQTRSEEMFLTTYKAISDNFQNMFRRLFGGGRAEITLADPENVLTSGIDIFAQPPGKKLISLTLLSGGERSMTAVALLFATYLVKPSPFCILDEIDAALDDKNIGFFLSVLEDFAQTSQFIIITHNKHTVMGSTQLLGVTQMEAGVSTTVTYKLARRAGQAVILNDEDKEVDFDADGRAKKK